MGVYCWALASASSPEERGGHGASRRQRRPEATHQSTTEIKEKDKDERTDEFNSAKKESNDQGRIWRTAGRGGGGDEEDDDDKQEDEAERPRRKEEVVDR